MKRFLYYLRNMDNSTTTFRELYEGAVLLQYPPKYDPLRDDYIPYPPEEGESNVYYTDLYSFRIEHTHKLAQDKPTVVLQIPCVHLGIHEPSDAAADFCLRQWIQQVDRLNDELNNHSRTEKENGKYEIYRPAGKRIRNNAAFFAECAGKDYEYGSGNVLLMQTDTLPPPELCLCLRMQIQLPHKKLKKVMRMFQRDLPDAVEDFIQTFDRVGFADALELADRQTQIRRWLADSPYCAFLANGSVFPRKSGTDLPLKEAIPFTAPQEDTITVCGISGLGIRRGVTVITGGGYSGKSTLLDTISAGIYDHVLGDGRELCITDASAMTISAEDGRSVQHLNIRPFLQWIPGKVPEDFSTEHASGATSQASNIMEAVEMRSKLLLIDEDRSATNFMIRDSMMQQMVQKEPIIPFTDRVQELFRKKGVSTILVIGGSGEFLSVADSVYVMDEFQMSNVSELAKQVSGGTVCPKNSPPPEAVWEQNRILKKEGFTSYPIGSGSERLEVMEFQYLRIGDEGIDMRGLHDIVSVEQLQAIGFILRNLMLSSTENEIPLAEKLQTLYEKLEKEDLDFLYSSYFTTCERFLVVPRKQEVYAVINRMRKIHYKKGE